MKTVTRTSTTRTTPTLFAPSADFTAGSSPAPFTFEQLVTAYYDCRKNKRNTRSALEFELHLERNLIQLRDDLLSGNYRIGKSVCFVITHPKPREVWAATFRDRIVHHLMYNHIAPTIEARFIADSCACIKGRGTLYAAQRLEHKIRSATHNWSKPCYYLKCDLANFFVSINKNILAELIKKHVAPGWWQQLTLNILSHDPRQNYLQQCSAATLNKVPQHKRLHGQPAHLGLAIGNLSSQFFANIYLNELDQFVKHTLKAFHYVRYVDDFIILHPDASWLNSAKTQIEQHLQCKLAAQLNPSKTIIQPVSRGVDFVGQVIKPWHRTLRRRTEKHAMASIKKVPAHQLTETVNSYFGLFRQTTHSRTKRAQLAKLVLMRGQCVNATLTKTYKRKSNGRKISGTAKPTAGARSE